MKLQCTSIMNIKKKAQQTIQNIKTNNRENIFFHEIQLKI